MYSRRLIIAVALMALCLSSSPSRSQTLSLWADEARTTNEVYANVFDPFDVYVYLDPGADGALTVEFKVIVPYGHISVTPPGYGLAVELAVGSPIGDPGVLLNFTTCQYGLLWVAHLTMMSSNLDTAIYQLAPHDDSEFMGITICKGTNPRRDAEAENVLFFNLEISNAQSSWGAIKDLYR